LKALLLDGSDDGDDGLKDFHLAMVEELEKAGWDVETWMLRDKKIASCTGCFGCWLKTPGRCVINDDAREIAGKEINSDLVVNLTRVIYGGYSYQSKKVIDRSLCLVLPFFEKIEGEIHHRPRYDKYPVMATLGVLSSPDDENERIFLKNAEYVAIDFHLPVHACRVTCDGRSKSGMRDDVRGLLEDAGALK